MALVVGFTATVKAQANVRSAPKIASTTLLRTLSQPESWTAIGWVKGDVDPDSGSDQWLMTWRNGRYEYTAKSNLSAGPTAPDTTVGFTQEELDAAVLDARRAQYDADAAAANADPVVIGPRP